MLLFCTIDDTFFIGNIWWSLQWYNFTYFLWLSAMYRNEWTKLPFCSSSHEVKCALLFDCFYFGKSTICLDFSEQRLKTDTWTFKSYNFITNRNPQTLFTIFFCAFNRRFEKKTFCLIYNCSYCQHVISSNFKSILPNKNQYKKHGPL